LNSNALLPHVKHNPTFLFIGILFLAVAAAETEGELDKLVSFERSHVEELEVVRLELEDLWVVGDGHSGSLTVSDESRLTEAVIVERIT
jgi:hypothetical protein